jgi:hypothetical protein
VEVVGTADPPVLDQFERSLATGPMLARVDNVEKADLSLEMEISNSFSIK